MIGDVVTPEMIKFDPDGNSGGIASLYVVTAPEAVPFTVMVGGLAPGFAAAVESAASIVVNAVVVNSDEVTEAFSVVLARLPATVALVLCGKVGKVGETNSTGL